ncbi:MAG: isoaspartyl peptidase/L-asparaginase [Myxococcales bacterium]|nr:isoaspartyl peptidase/L-asparaginase [Myxococcales bacterium]
MSVTASWQVAGGSFALLVHGGAGDVPEARVERHVEGCRLAAAAGRAVLAAGGSALDAAEAAVLVLEDDPVFNAGTGACLTSDGTLELDACVMEGTELRAGAVCALPPFKNPIAIARAVLSEGGHVLYAAEGARAYALRAGFAPAAPESMITELARAKLAEAVASGKVSGWAGGTVGAVARDVHGHVAAATSTGGMVGKRPGRVGDSPLVGAGTYADDLGGAASATGHGEGIIRVALCGAAVAALGEGREPEGVAVARIAAMHERVGATGGLILVTRDGKLGWARSTRTMSWAAAWDGSEGQAGA